MDPEKLKMLKEWLLHSDDRPFGAVVIHNGYIVLEVERDHSSVTNTKNVMSCAKAILRYGPGNCVGGKPERQVAASHEF